MQARRVINSEHYHTLEEIAHEIGLTRERVRTIQNTALKKLRLRCELLGYTPEDLFGGDFAADDVRVEPQEMAGMGRVS